MMNVRVRQDLKEEGLMIPVLNSDRYLDAKEVEAAIVASQDEDNDTVVLELQSGEFVEVMSIDLEYIN